MRLCLKVSKAVTIKWQIYRVPHYADETRRSGTKESALVELPNIHQFDKSIPFDCLS